MTAYDPKTATDTTDSTDDHPKTATDGGDDTAIRNAKQILTAFRDNEQDIREKAIQNGDDDELAGWAEFLLDTAHGREPDPTVLRKLGYGERHASEEIVTGPTFRLGDRPDIQTVVRQGRRVLAAAGIATDLGDRDR